MFAYTYGKDNPELKTTIEKEIAQLDLDEKYNLEVNVVKNREDHMLGYSYFWTDNEKIYNALVGLNLDGSPRVEEIIEENDDELELELNGDNWGDMASFGESKISYRDLEPLIKLPPFVLSKEEQERYKIFEETVDFDLQPAKIPQDYTKKNSLFARHIPNWLSEDKIFRYFRAFEKDKIVHHKKKEQFQYPIIRKRNNSVTVIFSNLYPNTATFVFNMSRKVLFRDDEGDRECLIFFKQNKK